ncbi:DUF3784 domain-containing protein [Natranaeroarchaeum aerophilus]|uniref:DUF3784 domain-containing protein n=1 Tax=Natranaeroarchaeum aerophilus TaxID=2917711 RepID=A0AAE3FTD9_9EURY|nr:DUF3784 domain-containing protein [Natranaeroarchaeum aerophilus]MCL9814785.1 DUF3784 domain-containing protein [Natranaeroarchaeum aerophilus]
MTDTVLSMLVATAVLTLIGVLIKYFGVVELIAGYDPDKIEDEDGLATFIGTQTLYVAALTAIVAGFEYTQPFDGYQGIWIVFVVGTLAVTVRMVRGARRYEKPV